MTETLVGLAVALPIASVLVLGCRLEMRRIRRQRERVARLNAEKTG